MITVIGDLVVDLIVQKSGNHYATDTESMITTKAGGQGNHVAAWIASTGGESTLIGCVGNDIYGDFLEREAKELGLKLALERDQNLETGKIVILVDQNNGERSMFNDRGANKGLTSEQIDHVETIIQNSTLLYISGYSLFDPLTRKAVEKAKELAIKHNTPIAIDPSSTYFLDQHRDYVSEFIRGIDFLFPNYEEGIMLTGKQRPEDIMRKLKIFVKNPVLTLGVDGCMVFHEDHLIHIKGHDVHPVDTTGAGDSFIGSFLSHYTKSSNLKEAAQHANNLAAKAVQNIGGRPI